MFRVRELRQPLRHLLGQWWLAGLAAVVCWLPIALAPVLPMGDAPGHLALASVLHRLLTATDPDFVLGTFPTPNAAVVLLLQPLLVVLPVLTAFKGLLLLGYFGAGAVAGGKIFERIGRRPAWGALVPPLLLGQHFLHGFVDFLAATPFLLALVATLLRPRQRWWSLWWLPVVGFLVHIQAWLLASVWLGWLALRGNEPTQETQHAEQPSLQNLLHRVGDALAVVLPGALLAGWWYWHSLRGGAGASDVRWGPALDVRLAELVHQSMLVLPTRQDDAILAVWLLSALWASSATPWWPAPRPLRAVVGLTALLYALLPDGMGAYVDLYQRTGAILLLLLPFVLLGGAAQHFKPPSPLRWAVLLLPALVSGWAWQERMEAFSHTAGGLREVLPCATPGSKLFFAPSDLGPTPGFDRFLLRHAAQYHVALQDGRTSFSFAWVPGRIVGQRQPGFDFEYAGRDLWQQSARLGRYDFALRFDPTPQPPIAGFAQRCAAGPWSLWARQL